MPLFPVTFFPAELFLVAAALLPILNPFGMAPIFFSMTQGLPDARVRSVALRVGLNAFFLLTAAMLVGSYVLAFFGVSLIAVRLGGGLLIVINGYKLLVSEDADCNTPERHTASTPDVLNRLAFYPLTFPLSVGPGSLTVAITLGANLEKAQAGFLNSIAASLFSIAAVSFILYLCYRHAHRLTGLLGSTGTVVLLRLSAFILLCIGVQILLGGATDFWKTLR